MKNWILFPDPPPSTKSWRYTNHKI